MIAADFVNLACILLSGEQIKATLLCLMHLIQMIPLYFFFFFAAGCALLLHFNQEKLAVSPGWRHFLYVT